MLNHIYSFFLSPQLFARVLIQKPLVNLGFPGLPQEVKWCTSVDLCGPEGTGKTELLMHIAIGCILPREWKSLQLNGNGVAAVFVDNDLKFSMVRFITLLQERIQAVVEAAKRGLGAAPDSASKAFAEDTQELFQECLSRFYVVQCTTTVEFLALLHSLRETVRFDQLVRVLLIDSITAFHWTEKCASQEAPGEFYAEAVRLLQQLQSSYSLTVFASRHPVSTGKHDSSVLCKEWTQFSTFRFTTESMPGAPPTYTLRRLFPANDSPHPFAIRNAVCFL